MMIIPEGYILGYAMCVTLQDKKSRPMTLAKGDG
jgi:hypothetical protein